MFLFFILSLSLLFVFLKWPIIFTFHPCCGERVGWSRWPAQGFAGGVALSSVGVFSACCAGRAFASVDGLGAGGVPSASARAAGRLAPRAGTEGVLPRALLFLLVQLAELLPALRVPAPSASVFTLPSSLFTSTPPAPRCLPRPGPARLVWALWAQCCPLTALLWGSRPPTSVCSTACSGSRHPRGEQEGSANSSEFSLSLA